MSHFNCLASLEAREDRRLGNFLYGEAWVDQLLATELKSCSKSVLMTMFCRRADHLLLHENSLFSLVLPYPGFEGITCERNIDDCPNHKCQNGGVCVDGVNTYNCRCPPQWTGMYTVVSQSEWGMDW